MPILDWTGKEALETRHRQAPFRLMDSVDKLSCNDKIRSGLIAQVDNLLALKALLPRSSGEIKSLYLDPLCNTGNEGWV